LPPDRIIKPNLAVDHNQWPRIVHAHPSGFHSTMFRIRDEKSDESFASKLATNGKKRYNLAP
jgi:hypothetical protein